MDVAFGSPVDYNATNQTQPTEVNIFKPGQIMLVSEKQIGPFVSALLSPRKTKSVPPPSDTSPAAAQAAKSSASPPA